jgi:hypothetical protein
VNALLETDASAGRGLRGWHAACLVATPWLQLLVNPNLFMTPGGNRYIDPWVYTGLFLSLPEHLRFMPDTYYGARLSWLIPGYLAHSTFTPLVANYVLHLGFFYALLLATYKLIESAAGTRHALLVTLAVAWNPIVLAAIGWDYVDGAGIVFIVGSLLALEKAARAAARRQVWMVAAGALMACLVSGNFFLITMLPVFGLFYALRAGIAHWRQFPIALLFAGAGAGATLAALGFASAMLGGRWMFLAPQVLASRGLLSAPSDYAVPVSVWILRATWLVLPVIGILAALRGLVNRPAPEAAFVRVMERCLLLAAVLWVVVQVAGVPVVQISYYTSYLAPLALIVLTLRYGVSSQPLPIGRIIALEIFTVVLFAAWHGLVIARMPDVWRAIGGAFRSPLPVYLWGDSDFLRQLGVLTLVGLAGGLVILAVVHRIGGPGLRWAAFAASLAVASVAMPSDLPMASDRSNPAYFETTVAAHRYIAAQRALGRVTLWYSLADPLSPVLGLVNTFFWGNGVINATFPNLTSEQAAALRHGQEVILLVSRFEMADLAQAPLQSHGYRLAVVEHREFGPPEQPLSVVIGRLE